MSIKSWCEEFYQVKATHEEACETDVKAIEHSLVKWRGLLPENLKKHHVRLGVFGNSIEHDDSADIRAGSEVFLDSSSCALCVKRAWDRSA